MKVWALKEQGYYDSEPRVLAITTREEVAKAWEDKHSLSVDDYELDDLSEVTWRLRGRVEGL